MKSKIIWIICGLGSLALTFPISIAFYRNFEVYTQGNLVNVTLTYIPKINGGSRSFDYMKFNYNRATYYIQVYNTDIFMIGEDIQLRYLKGFENNFLFPGDNPIPSGILCIMILIGIASGSAYYFFKSF